MGREMFIVGRDRPDLYRYLSQTFADAENVQVILDRRERDRRVSPGQRIPERRHGERRARPSVDADLQAAGYTFITLD